MKNLATSLIAASYTPPAEGNVWDIAYAWELGDSNNFWDVQGTVNVVYQQVSSVSAEDNTPTALWFKPDGSKMYIFGSFGDDVIEYDLSRAWDIGSKTYVQEIDVSAQEGGMSGLVFKPDGYKFYLSGNTNDKVYEYSLTTAWDVSTASYSQSASLDSNNTTPNGMFINATGVHLYTVDYGSNEVFQYSLSTAWDVSTLSYVRKFSIATYETGSTGITFKADGTEMYTIGFQGAAVDQWSLTTAWDVSTASFLQSRGVSGQETSPSDIHFKPDGSAFFIIGVSGDEVNAFTVGRGEFTLSDSTTVSIAFNDDGTKMYTLGDQYNDVHEYDLSTAWDIYTATYNQAMGGSMETTTGTYENNPSGMAFKSDGTKLYVVGTGLDRVNEYTLSTAWDISTKSYSANFSVSSQESAVQDITFNDDGTKMYIIGSGGDEVNEYSLSTAWDVTSASFYQAFSVSSQTTVPESLVFKSDGTKLFILGGSRMYEYDLTTAWDISSLAFSKSIYFNIDSIGTTTPYPQGIYFSNDGDRFFVVRGNEAYQFVMQ